MDKGIGNDRGSKPKSEIAPVIVPIINIPVDINRISVTVLVHSAEKRVPMVAACDFELRMLPLPKLLRSTARWTSFGRCSKDVIFQLPFEFKVLFFIWLVQKQRVATTNVGGCHCPHITSYFRCYAHLATYM